MTNCTNCQELESKFNKLYTTSEGNRKSREQFSEFLSKLASGESLDKMEIIRQFKNFVSLKEANEIAKKFID